MSNPTSDSTCKPTCITVFELSGKESMSGVNEKSVGDPMHKPIWITVYELSREQSTSGSNEKSGE
jgi:hypothetical protein